MQGKIQRIFTRQFPINKIFRSDSPYEIPLEFEFYEDFEDDLRIIGVPSVVLATAVGEPSLLVTVLIEGTPKPTMTMPKLR
jgi:hypothetical protein